MAQVIDIQGYARDSRGLIDLSVVRKGVIINEQHEMLVANGLPPYAEIVRKGNHWGTMATSAVAALVVRPTTTAAFLIHNGYTDGTVLIIDRVFTHELVTSTTGLGGGAGLYAMITPPMAPPSDGTFAINSLSGKAALAYKPGGITSVGKVTAAASVGSLEDNGWFPWGSFLKKESAGAVVPGGVITEKVEGRLIVPPRCALALHVVSGYTADTFTSGADWYEEKMVLY